jgi:hypothetical protein
VLVNRRRLGQTDLAVKAGQVGTSNATKPRNLGTFDYAHLRAPLPKNIVSGIFKPAPASYFLMRRSNDGYISATGMFKATFPWAELKEEEDERNYIKSLPTTSPDETAGNVWIPPTHALELAEEYHIGTWIKALLDPTAIEVNPGKDATPKTISPPPTFLLPQEALAAPQLNGRGRARRSASPSKIASPKKSTATPRKPKTPKHSTANSDTNAANKSLHQALKAAAKAADSESVTSEEPAKDAKDSEKDETESKDIIDEEQTVHVTVDTDVEIKGDVETTHTHVEVEMPALFADMPLPEDTEGIIAKAKEMVEAAIKAENAIKSEEAAAGPSKLKKSKRKVDSVEADENDAGESAEASEEAGPLAKKLKVEENELRKERVKTRALIGISATLAIGYVSPFIIPSPAPFLCFYIEMFG